MIVTSHLSCPSLVRDSYRLLEKSCVLNNIKPKTVVYNYWKRKISKDIPNSGLPGGRILPKYINIYNYIIYIIYNIVYLLIFWIYCLVFCMSHQWFVHHTLVAINPMHQWQYCGCWTLYHWHTKEKSNHAIANWAFGWGATFGRSLGWRLSWSSPVIPAQTADNGVWGIRSVSWLHVQLRQTYSQRIISSAKPLYPDSLQFGFFWVCLAGFQKLFFTDTIWPNSGWQTVHHLFIFPLE
jgi:hypothetical protein